MEMILETADLCKSFKNQMAVNNVSLHLKGIPSIGCSAQTELVKT